MARNSRDPRERDDDDDDDHLDEETEERYGEIARAVQDYIHDGEELVIRSEEDGISVEPHQGENRFREIYPRLYGRLSSIAEQMNSGCASQFVCWFFGLACIFAINSSWADHFDEAVVGPMRSWWFYGLLMLGMTLVSFVPVYLRESLAYRRNRAELIRVMVEEQFDRDLLVTLIEDLPRLSRVVMNLKLDRGPFPEAPDDSA